ncbi:hypothetical protein V1515DRAFT_542125 [Lipomyces mesembrius]
MRRRSDAWMNATQILKVANFDKPQRTRILEREVQKGIHEKIQGGYGKYQGTWVPLDRGREIAMQYRVEELLRPVFEFRPTSTSPPPAPKHITASSVRGRLRGAGVPRHAVSSVAVTAVHSKRAAAAAAGSAPARRAAAAGRTRGRVRHRFVRGAVYGRGIRDDDDEEDEEENDDDGEENEQMDEDEGIVEDEEAEEDNEMDEVGSEDGPLMPGRHYTHRQQQVLTDDESISANSDSLSSGTSSPSDSGSDETETNSGDELAVNGNSTSRRKRKLQEVFGHGATLSGIAVAQMEYSNRLLDYFLVPDDDKIPDFLVHPPADFDVNAAIDDEGHTPFHWACAIGHIRMIEALLRAGADITIVNNLGQTPLIRAIMFTNNYERRTFPKVVDLLQSTIFHFDRFGQTVLHHIAAITTSKSKHSAARYYIEVILGKLTETQARDTLTRFLNQQDSNGDTALHIAARNGSRKCIKVFLGYGANTKLSNKQGQVAQSYIYAANNAMNAQKSSSSPVQAFDHQAPNGHVRAASYGSARRHSGVNSAPIIAGQTHIVPHPHVSEAAIQAIQKVVPAMADHLEALATAYDAELQDKEADLAQATQLLVHMRKDIRVCETTVRELRGESGDGDGAKIAEETTVAEERVAARATELRKVVERTQKRDLLKLVREEEVKLLSFDGGGEGDKRHGSKFNHVAAGDSSSNRLGQDLAKELYILQVERRKMVDDIVELWAAAGVGEKMNDYRRLISLSCNVKVEEIDDLLDGISQALNNDGGE